MYFKRYIDSFLQYYVGFSMIGYFFFLSYLLFLPIFLNNEFLTKNKSQVCEKYIIQGKYSRTGKNGGNFFHILIDGEVRDLHIKDAGFWAVKKESVPITVCLKKGFFGYNFVSEIKD